ncbi:MAG TPA: FliH/SctL family protein, partial [Candidatus Binatia bacterium]|nr:FliH/SctL family protein [Candidatus Binatia bacterium]
AVAAAGAVAAELERLAPRDAARAAAAIARLALVVAERILGGALALDPALLVSVIERATAAINGSPSARVILHPTARPIVEAAWLARFGTAYLGKRWVFEADPSLPPTGCRLVYEHGFVDASLDAQIEEIGRAIEHALPTLLREVGVVGRERHAEPPADEGAPAREPGGGR